MENNHRESLYVLSIVAAIILIVISVNYYNSHRNASSAVNLPNTSSASQNTPSSNGPAQSQSSTSTTVSPPPQPEPAQSCYTAEQAWNEMGQTGCVQFTVGYTYTSSRCNAYLDQYSNYSSGFEVWIPDGCGLGETLTNEYTNTTIDVTGAINSYYGTPEIEVTAASQVQLAN